MEYFVTSAFSYKINKIPNSNDTYHLQEKKNASNSVAMEIAFFKSKWQETQSNVCEREPKNGVQLQMNIQKLFLFFICLYAAEMNLCYYYKLCAYRIVKWQIKKEEMKQNAREMTTNNDELPSLNTSKITVRKKWCTEKNARIDNVPNQSKNCMLFVLWIEYWSRLQLYENLKQPHTYKRIGKCNSIGMTRRSYQCIFISFLELFSGSMKRANSKPTKRNNKRSIKDAPTACVAASFLTHDLRNNRVPCVSFLPTLFEMNRNLNKTNGHFTRSMPFRKTEISIELSTGTCVTHVQKTKNNFLFHDWSD